MIVDSIWFFLAAVVPNQASRDFPNSHFELHCKSHEPIAVKWPTTRQETRRRP